MNGATPFDAKAFRAADLEGFAATSSTLSVTTGRTPIDGEARETLRTLGRVEDRTPPPLARRRGSSTSRFLRAHGAVTATVHWWFASREQNVTLALLFEMPDT
jgi:hypothetical protein